MPYKLIKSVVSLYQKEANNKGQSKASCRKDQAFLACKRPEISKISDYCGEKIIASIPEDLKAHKRLPALRQLICIVL